MPIWNPFSKTIKTKAASGDINSPWFLELMRSGRTKDLSPDSAMQISAVYSCVKVIAESVASMPINLYKVSDGSRVLQSGHSLNRLVHNAPNDWLTAPEYWTFVMAGLLLQGESFSYIVRTSTGVPVQLLPILNQNVSVQIEAQNRIMYRVNLGKDGKDHSIMVSPENMLHFRGMTLDGVRGVSPIGYNLDLLGQAKDAKEFQRTVFTNGATPRGVLTTEGVLSDEAYENLAKSWGAQHGGVENSNRVAILEGGYRFEKISMSPADIELLAQFKYTRSEIAGMFRVPPHMIGDLERSTNNNIEHQGLDFYTNTLLPWITFIESRLNFQLLGTSTQAFAFDSSKVVQGTFDDRVTAFGKLLTLGVMNPNEVRGELGYNPREGGDEYVSQSNNLTFGSPDDKPDEPQKEPNKPKDKPDADKDI